VLGGVNAGDTHFDSRSPMKQHHYFIWRTKVLRPYGERGYFGSYGYLGGRPVL